MTDYLSLVAQHGFQFSLSFYNVGATQRVALASVNEVSSKDDIFISSCTAAGCTGQSDYQVDLPTSWYLSFIGNDNTAPTVAEQVYYKFVAFSSELPMQPSSGSASWKYDLEMTPVIARLESTADDFPMMAWGGEQILS